ncbi:hypothetical protein FOZG_14564 [Fusarium oxysporum Fo47]|uniref:Zn(2)-C6 fungal-type domain-containing protein n=1 Tax=Fusarium oxysporum Fo47 TaxID=660027 RepID=W9JRD0_FUSOX|nr:hypothetical protein FOZG_14564 [Fusarium oxysporum Fo47]
MSGTSDTGENPLASTWNCLNCRRRKVRCDRKNPCSHCSRSGKPCVFPQSGRLPRRPPASTVGAPGHSGGRSRDLLDRIRRLEGIVNTFNTNLEHGRPLHLHGVPESASENGARASTARAGLPTERPHSTEEPEGGHRHAGFLVSGQDGKLYIGGDFWSTLCREVSLIREAFEAEEKVQEQTSSLPLSGLPSNSAPSLKSSPSDYSTWIFQKPPTFEGTVIDAMFPMPSQMFFIWQAYVENIDPFLKIIHVPSITEALMTKGCRLAIMEPAMRALLSCISFAAIASLTEEEVVRLNYGVDKKTLSLRFRAGAEAALARADFMNTATLMTIQAFTIFLSVLQCEESPRFIWSLTGILIRLAVSLGLHKDGSQFKGISPFEIEIRRRVWWHICFLDARTGDSHFHDAQIPETLFDTRYPSNVDDTDIDPHMGEPVLPREGPTDMSICLVRCRIWRMVRAMRTASQHANADNTVDGRSLLEHSLDAVREFRESLVSPHQSGWPRNSEQDSFLRIMTDVVASRVELMAYYQERLSGTFDPAAQEDLFNVAIKVVDLAYKLGRSPSMSKWAWITQGFLQWQPLIIILGYICAVPWGACSEKAWSTVGRCINTMPEGIKHEPLWQPLQRLLSRTYQHRISSTAGEATQRYRQHTLTVPTAACEPPPEPQITPPYSEEARPVASNPPHGEGEVGQWACGPMDTTSSANGADYDWLADAQEADFRQWLIW